MNILHTSDWHIGKKLMNRDRLSEQREVLDEIIEIVEQNAVELVLIAGDVYDTFMPQAEAENLFFYAVRRLAGENRAVLIISGNHDDGVRLSACSPLGEELGVYVVSSPKDILSTTSTRPVRPVQSGEGYVVFENAKGERVYINTLPYPNEARLKEEKNDESYPDKIKRWIEVGRSAYKGGMPEILLSHLFVTGGIASDGERDIDLGGARAVPLNALPDCDYIALGHLHKKQHFKQKNVWYSGSILQYAFDESGTQKRVVLLQTDAQKLVLATEIPLTKGKRLLRLQADSPEEGMALLQQNPDTHVELTLRLSAPLTSENTRALLSHKNLKSLIPAVQTDGGQSLSFSRRELGVEELFEEYYRSVYATAPDSELKTLFLQLLGEETA
ncbi:MAG: exonuclease subunit SbcD [Clostridia bacterium]|nr:exonuclease subunit SbcD [Clostridia bacterium]